MAVNVCELVNTFLQIGLRCDSAIASICDETGVEIENAELLFTKEGHFMNLKLTRICLLFKFVCMVFFTLSL